MKKIPTLNKTSKGNEDNFSKVLTNQKGDRVKEIHIRGNAFASVEDVLAEMTAVYQSIPEDKISQKMQALDSLADALKKRSDIKKEEPDGNQLVEAIKVEFVDSGTVEQLSRLEAIDAKVADSLKVGGNKDA